MQQPEPDLQPPGASAATTTAHTRRRKRALRLLAHLQALSSTFHEFRSVLQESLDLVKHEIDRNPDSDRQFVLSAIHLGAWTIDELQDETKLRRAEIQKILDQLHAAKIILRKESQEYDKRDGRPKILWLPAPNHQPEK